MADHHISKRTLKCSVSKLPMALWFRCIILMCIIQLPGILSRCYPVGRAHVLYGNPVELFCIADSPDDGPEDLEFRVNNQVLNDTELVNATTRRLFIQKPEKSLKSYHCRTKTDMCVIRVLVGDPPKDVTDFGCISYNLIKLKCNWTITPDLAVIDYSLTIEFNGNRLGPNKAKKNGNESYWIWDTAYRQQEETFNITLTATTQFGTNIQHFNIDHFAIVKPDPPSNLQVLINKSHQVKLHWEIPTTMVELLGCGIEHRIEYQIAKVDQTKHFRTVNASMLPKTNNKTYSFWLKNLPYAHMQYEVKIYIRSRKAVKEEFWSNYSYIVFTTVSERPSRPPDVIAGAFSETEIESKRTVMIYWRQLEEYEEAGANFTYMVNVTYSNKTNTFYPDKNISLSYVRLTDLPWQPMQVSVASINEKGLSPNSSHFFIPPKADSNLKVTKFSQIAFEGNIYKLSWGGIGDKIDNYTLFWCQHNITNICSGRLNFTVLEPYKTSHKIALPRRDRYQFAISANRGLDTSGIVWASCDISNDTLLMYNFPVEVSHEQPGKTHVNITWSLICSIHREPNQTTIKGYKITYCIVLKTSNECDPAYDKMYVNIPNPLQEKTNITNLLPFKTYLFTLSLETIFGWKNLENASTAITTTEDTPTSPRNVTVSNITSDSVVLSFDPPNPRNGIIGNYKIYNYSDLLKVVDVVNDSTDTVRRHVTVTGLRGFSTYSLTVKACNSGIKVCSEVSPREPIVFTTKIGPPAQLKAPKFTDSDVLIWQKPDPPGGNVTYYDVRVVKDNDKEGSKEYRAQNMTFKVSPCENVRFVETYQVRAVNIDGNQNVYEGKWSEPSHYNCRPSNSMTIFLVIMGLVAIAVIAYGCKRLYHMYKDMDIKPIMPEGVKLESEKIAFAWNPNMKDNNKSSNDETLPLTTKPAAMVPSEIKQQKDASNCNSSDHTDSTALSDTSRGHIDRHPSTSDDDSTYNLEVDTGKVDCSNNAQDEEYSLNNSDNDSYRDPFNDKPFKVNLPPVPNLRSGYVQSVPPVSFKSAPKPPAETASSSYVKAGLPHSIFTTGVVPPPVRNNPPTSSGYVLRDDVQANLPSIRPSQSLPFGPNSLPTTPSLPQPAKHGGDSSYIQLQSLDSLSSLKPTERNIVPTLKPTAPNISPGDAVINKHFNNLMSAGQMADEPAILDPKMSPDAYCRFSWSTDPANDNLQSMYSPTTVNSFKN